MTSLLTLPPELRDEIIDLIISSAETPPIGENPDARQRVQLEDIKYHGWFGDNGVKYDTAPECYTPNSLGLLLTNHQLHEETASRIAHTRRMKYTLDVMMVKEKELWPTWTCITALSTRVDTVTATFRIVGHCTGGSGFRGGTGGPPLIYWSFYSLLERFLKVGPVGPVRENSRTRDRRITIRTLELDVKTGKEIPKEHELASIESSDEDTGRRFMIPVDAKKLSGQLIGMISILLDMCYYTAEFGAILFERVGTIRMSLDGEMQKEWDLAARLAEFPPDGPHETFQKGRQANFRKWRERALQLREQANLPVRPPISQVEG